MRLWLLAILLSSVLLFGCFGPDVPPAPAYKAPAVKNQTPAPVRNLTRPPTLPAPPKNETAPKNTAVSRPPPKPVQNGTAPAKNASSVRPSNASASNAAANITAPAPLPCNGLRTSEALECLAAESISKKDVALCTQLTAAEDRYACFTRFCYSAARDFKQCDKLTNTDDRLGCIQKCSPNFNT